MSALEEKRLVNGSSMVQIVIAKHAVKRGMSTLDDALGRLVSSCSVSWVEKF